jgi:hypothetical protein
MEAGNMTTKAKKALKYFGVSSTISIVLLLTGAATAQVPVTDSVVPRLVNYAGVAKDDNGKVMKGVIGATFAVYAEQDGGSPLWMETQNINASANGTFSVQLGATKPDGLPVDVFSAGQARWLGVSYNGGAEQPRIALLSVPYALKAGDAQTLGGLPASAFVLAVPTSSSPAAPAALATVANGTETAPPPAGDVTGAGTANFIPLWTSASAIGNSSLFQSGTGASAKVGVNTKTPAAALDVKGSSMIRGLLALPSISTATAAAGSNSQALNWTASAFNSSSSAAVNENFRWQAEPLGNNTSTPSGSLNLLFGSGSSTPAETGLKIASNGQLTFAPGQSFPGAGTITGVTTASGSGLTGGGSSGTLALGLTTACSKNQTLQWSGSAWACSSTGTGTITGVTAGTDLTGGGSSGNVTLNLDTTKVPQLAASNNFTANQSVSGNISATGSLSGSSGAFTGNGANLVLNVTQNASSGSTYAIVGTSHAAGNGAAILGQNLATTGQSFGVEGFSASSRGIGVYGQFNLPNSQTGVGSNGAGVWGDGGFSDFGTGVLGTTDSGDAVVGINNDFGDAAVLGINNSIHDNAWGMWASSASSTGVGILGTAVNLSGTYLAHSGAQPFGVIGTVADVSGGLSSIGVWGATDGGYAVLGENTSTSAPAGAFFNLSNVAGNPAFEAGSSLGLCTVDTSANLVCAGSITAAVQAGGAKKVAMYSMQSPENWLEDFGSGELSAGRAEIALDPTFAETISAGDYHIFLTPNGDCKGLYVEAKAAGGFVVRELGGGSSKVAFDFRVVGKRRGYETVRLTDVTEAQGRLMTQTRLVTQAKNLDPAKAEIRDNHHFRVRTKSSASEGELKH